MTSDDQHFLDILSSISSDIYHYSEEVCDYIDSVFERSALPLREALSDAPWWPDAFKRITHEPQVVAKPAIDATGIWSWVQRNKALSAAAMAFICSGTGMAMWMLWDRGRKHYVKKRRARRGLDGNKLDVVVVAGIPDTPLPRSIILDLERRGFIVYVVVTNSSDEQLVKHENKTDIIPLYLNITSQMDVQMTIQCFAQLLKSPQSLVATGPSESLHLAGIVVVPDVTYPLGPIEVIDPEVWSDAFNAKFLKTVATIQAFLPLVRTLQARILLLSPSITSSLRPCFHGVETTIVKALEYYVDTLAAEVYPTNASISHFKVGEIDNGISGQLQLQRSRHGEVTAWPSIAQKAYAENFLEHKEIGSGLLQFEQKVKGSPLRELNNAVFDTLTQARPSRVVHVGRGSLLYDLVERWSPPGFVRWMLSRKHSFPPAIARNNAP